MNRQNALLLRVAMVPWSCLVLMAIAVPYFLSKGLSLPEIFLSHSVMSITLALCELPSGYLSDRYSRKATLLLASAAKAAGGIVAVYADNLPLLLLCYVFIGVAISFYSGTDLAIIHDAYGDDQPAITGELANLIMIGNLSSTAGIVLGGIISTYSLHYAAVANAAISCLPFFVFLFLKSPPSPAAKPRRTWQDLVTTFTSDIKVAKKVLLNSGTDTPLLFVLLVLIKVPTIMALLTYQSFFGELGLDSGDISVIIGSSVVISGLGAKLVPWIETKLSRPALLGTSFLVVALAYSANALASAPLAILSFAVIDCAKVFMMVYLVKEFNKDLEPSLRATLNSVMSLTSRIVLAVFAALWGVGLSRFGIEASSLAMAGLYLLLFVALMAYLTPSKTAKAHQSPLQGS